MSTVTNDPNPCCAKHIALCKQPKVSPLYHSLCHSDWPKTYRWTELVLQKLRAYLPRAYAREVRPEIEKILREHIENRLNATKESSTAFKVRILNVITPPLLAVERPPFKALEAHFHWAIIHQKEFGENKELLERTKTVWADVKQRKQAKT